VGGVGVFVGGGEFEIEVGGGVEFGEEGVIFREKFCVCVFVEGFWFGGVVGGFGAVIFLLLRLIVVEVGEYHCIGPFTYGRGLQSSQRSKRCFRKDGQRRKSMR